MKKKRYLPFGYQMNEGNIIPDILESSAVQSIFENYRNGASLQMLAKQILLDFKNLNILNAKTKIFPAHSLRISVHTNGEIKFPISQ